MVKVIRLPLIYAEDKNDNDMDYKKVNEVLWDLQKQTRKIKNRVIQLCWEYGGFASDYKQAFQKNLSAVDVYLKDVYPENMT